MFYCDGKKDFCVCPDACCSDCPHFNDCGGEEVEVPVGATRWWFFRFRLKKRLKSLWYKVRRK